MHATDSGLSLWVKEEELDMLFDDVLGLGGTGPLTSWKNKTPHPQMEVGGSFPLYSAMPGACLKPSAAMLPFSHVWLLKCSGCL